MADSQNNYTGDGSTKQFTISFSYEAEADVAVYVDGAAKVKPTDYDFLDSTTIEFTTAPASGTYILLRRESSFTKRPTDWTNAAILTESDHDLEDDTGLHRDQEIRDRKGLPPAVKEQAWDAQADQDDDTPTELRIINVKDPTAQQDVVTKKYLEDYVTGGSTGLSGVHRKQYTGDGTTKTFNIVTSGSGLITDEKLIEAFLDGLNIDNTEFALAANKIDVTFTEAPGNGVAIDLRVVTAAIAELDDGSVLPAKIQMANETLLTGDSNSEGTAVARNTIAVSDFGAADADLSMGSNKLTNVTDPTDAQDAATKTYVDQAELDAKLSTAAASPAAYTPGTSIENANAHSIVVNMIRVDSDKYSTEGKRVVCEIDSATGFPSPDVVGAMTSDKNQKHLDNSVFFVPAGWFFRAREIDGRTLNKTTLTYQVMQ